MKEYPAWANGDHVTFLGGRERVVCGFRFMADEGRDRAQPFTDLTLVVFHDGRHWCYAPEEGSDA